MTRVVPADESLALASEPSRALGRGWSRCVVGIDPATQGYDGQREGDSRALREQGTPPGVPTFVFNGRVLAGFGPPESSGPLLAALVEQRSPVAGGGDAGWFGTLSVQRLGLPLFTLAIGLLDGFNPCAMWTLVFLMGLLVGMPDRTHRWTLGMAFVAASAVVYYLIMAAWLNALLFLGMVVWIRVAIGLVALAAGFYYLREFVLKKAAVCEVTRPERRRRVFEQLRGLASERRFAVALAGIVLLHNVVGPGRLLH